MGGVTVATVDGMPVTGAGRSMIRAGRWIAGGALFGLILVEAVGFIELLRRWRQERDAVESRPGEVFR